jgi:hypothetical protein
VSYILDALKKAAEQRSGPPPEVRRLLSPAPVAAASWARYITLGAAAAGAIAVATVVWMWQDAPPPPKAIASQAPASPARPVGAVVAVPVPDDKPRAIDTSPSSDLPRTAAVAAAKPRAIAETKPPRTTPLGVASPSVTAPGPPVVASLPPAPAAPRTDVARLKVEVIVYSDQRPLRWVFINGRKYVEGDTIGDARIEEIQSTGVVLVEDGRRITLRPRP